MKIMLIYVALLRSVEREILTLTDTIAIQADNLTKTYKLYDSPMDRLKESLHPFRRKYHHDFFALNNVNFDVKKGETVGIIGKNGSGKSTLLKLLTGVLALTSGRLTVNGRISALLELGAGFNPLLTGLENIYFNGMLMGYGREEMDAKLDQILAFADIGEFVYQPVKAYSSGMFVRLAFAVAINVEPEMLIVDEALGVGDVFFQQKCYAEIRRKIDNGTTFIFVSHDIQAVRNLCQRCLLLQGGVLAFDGSPEEAVSRYMAKLGSGPTQKMERSFDEPLSSCGKVDAVVHSSYLDIMGHSILEQGKPRHGAGGVLIESARVTDGTGRDTLCIPMLEEIQFSLLIKAILAVHDPSAGIHLYDRLGNLVFAAGTRQLGVRLPDLEAGQMLIVKLHLSLTVQPGEYTFSLGIAEPAFDGLNIGFQHDRWENLGPLVVTDPGFQILPFYGIAQLPLRAEGILVRE